MQTQTSCLTLAEQSMAQIWNQKQRGRNAAEKAQAEEELPVQGCSGKRKQTHGQFKEKHRRSGMSDLSVLVRFQLEYCIYIWTPAFERDVGK